MRTSSKILSVIAAGLALVTCGRADSLQLNTNVYTDIIGGGELTVTNSGLSTASYGAAALYCRGFATFSVEYGEHYSPGGTYSFTQSQVAHGGDTPSGSDPISMGTAWLYSQFAAGTLSGYSYAFAGSTRIASALDLQLALWYLEDETGTIPTFQDFALDNPNFDPSTNIFINAAISHFGDLESAKADSNGAFGVVVLNLTSGEANKQSQLYLAAPPSSVPEASATFGLLCAALVGLAGFRRRLSK